MSALAQVAYPIFQAPIGAAASIELVAAVSKAGACGSLAMTWTEPAATTETIRELRELTDGPFAAIFALSFSPQSLDIVLAAGAPIVTLSWGISRKHIARAQHAGASVGVQVGSMAGARTALVAGADFVICQGLEAGGHVQSTTRLADLIAGIKELDIRIPLIAAGGIVDSDDVAEYVDRGAYNVMLGTTFVATHESRDHSDYKSAVLKSGPHDTCHTW